MRNGLKRITSLFMLVLLLFCQYSVVFAEVQLPEGTVAGLPERLMVMDDEGNSVNSTGEYFFLVEGMKPNVDYTKEIEIMNLREDKSYHIYFYALPLDKEGQIDLENNCRCEFSLNGNKFFEGKVTGEPTNGGINLLDEPYDLGLYKPGDSSKMECKIAWNGVINEDYIVDNGARVIDQNGEHIVREKNGQDHVWGQVRFRWIFYAVVEDEQIPPKTGVLGVATIWYIVILSVLTIGIIILFVLLKNKKKKER